MPEFPAGDPRQIWQRQPTESFKMSTNELRRKAQHREERSRLEALTSIGIGVALCLVFGWSAAKASHIEQQIGWALTSLACLYVARQAYHWVWPGRLAPDATPGATMLFYRTILQKRLDYNRQVWRRSGLPFVFLGVAIALVPPLVRSPRLSINAAPFFVLLAVWFALYLPKRKQQRRTIQQEIDELRGLERDY